MVEEQTSPHCCLEKDTGVLHPIEEWALNVVQTISGLAGHSSSLVLGIQKPTRHIIENGHHSRKVIELTQLEFSAFE